MVFKRKKEGERDRLAKRERIKGTGGIDRKRWIERDGQRDRKKEMDRAKDRRMGIERYMIFFSDRFLTYVQGQSIM